MTKPGSSMISISQDGNYAVRVHAKELSVHLAADVERTRFFLSVRLKEPLASQLKFVKISRPDVSDDDQNEITTGEEGPLDLVPHQRVLCASDSRVSVWQISSLEWHADIENIEPTITSVDFGAGDDEVILFHAWNSKVTIFNLATSHSQVIKSPKFCNPNSHGHGYRPRTRQLALLLKPEANDLLTVHEAHTYEVITKMILPTVDAQGLKWSPDGKWIAIWDAASSGTKILIYTADGQLYRTYSGPTEVDQTHDLGVRMIEWTPTRKQDQSSPLLGVGKFDGTVDLLNTRTVSKSENEVASR
jgi:WD40 repeat protein